LVSIKIPRLIAMMMMMMMMMIATTITQTPT
jgi:hypothetical protein